MNPSKKDLPWTVRRLRRRRMPLQRRPWSLQPRRQPLQETGILSGRPFGRSIAPLGRPGFVQIPKRNARCFQDEKTAFRSLTRRVSVENLIFRNFDFFVCSVVPISFRKSRAGWGGQKTWSGIRILRWCVWSCCEQFCNFIILVIPYGRVFRCPGLLRELCIAHLDSIFCIF